MSPGAALSIAPGMALLLGGGCQEAFAAGLGLFHEVLLPIFSADSLIVRHGPDVVLDRASLTIHSGERLGLVGRNGSGKSTFLQIVAGVLEPDSGTVSRRRDLSIGYLPQVSEPAADLTVRG